MLIDNGVSERSGKNRGRYLFGNQWCECQKRRLILQRFARRFLMQGNASVVTSVFLYATQVIRWAYFTKLNKNSYKINIGAFYMDNS